MTNTTNSRRLLTTCSIPILLACLFCVTARGIAIAETQSETVMVPLRDGVRLATDIYRDSATTTAPVVLMRTPYKGENQWHESETWPPTGFAPASFYLHSAGHANTRGGDGRLDRAAPATSEPTDRFRADPADPVPACPVTEQRPLHAAIWAPVDQRELEDRPDVLCYATESLVEPLTFAGNASAELFVSADTPDADWVVKLIDVHPDGAAYNLAVGILRGRFRDSELDPRPLEPNKTYKISVDLGPVAAHLAAGHRLRVDICGAYFPLFDRNPNTAEGPFGKATAIAIETVYHAPPEPSRILLPVSSSGK